MGEKKVFHLTGSQHRAIINRFGADVLTEAHRPDMFYVDEDLVNQVLDLPKEPENREDSPRRRAEGEAQEARFAGESFEGKALVDEPDFDAEEADEADEKPAKKRSRKKS